MHVNLINFLEENSPR